MLLALRIVFLFGLSSFFVGCEIDSETPRAKQTRSITPRTPRSFRPAPPLKHEATHPEIPVSAAAAVGSDQLKAPSVVNPPLYIWSQVVVGNKLAIRAIVDKAEKCPTVRIDGNAHTLKIRATHSEAFPVNSCEFELSHTLDKSDAKHEVKIGDASVPTHFGNGERFAVIGDTGCEANHGGCNNENFWPFPKIAQSIVHVLQNVPGFIVHVGDYIYREGCVNGAEACGPQGDTWDAWNADFFSPAGVMLRAHPFVFLRGNHEQCARAYQGWMRFLDANPYREACEKQTKPFVVKTAHLNALLLDSSDATDVAAKVDPNYVDAMVENMNEVFTQYFKPNEKPGWIFTHRPIWGCMSWNYGLATGCDISTGRTLKSVYAKIHGAIDRRFSAVVSGHLPQFGILTLKDNGPMQIIIGNSGAVITPPSWLYGMSDSQRERKDYKISGDFGFSVVTSSPCKNGYDLKLYNVSGVENAHYLLHGNQLTDNWPLTCQENQENLKHE